MSISRVQHSISFQAPKLEDREGGKKKQDGHERRRKLAVPAVSTHKCHNKPYTIKLSQQYLPESTQSISMSPPPRTAADGCAEHDARAEAGRRAAAEWRGGGAGKKSKLESKEHKHCGNPVLITLDTHLDASCGLNRVTAIICRLCRSLSQFVAVALLLQRERVAACDGPSGT